MQNQESKALYLKMFQTSAGEKENHHSTGVLAQLMQSKEWESLKLPMKHEDLETLLQKHGRKW